MFCEGKNGRSKFIGLKSSLFIVFVMMLEQVVAACGSETTPVANPAATRIVVPTLVSTTVAISPTPTSPTVAISPTAPPPSPKACPMIAADPIPYTLDQLVRGADTIFLGEITTIDDFIWNTPDGGVSPDLCSYIYYQVAPTHVIIKENLKGNLQAGSSVTLLLPDLPDSLPHILPIKGKIKIGASLVWFLGGSTNFRLENPNNPLNSPIVRGLFYKSDNKWTETSTYVSFPDIAFLKERIKNPPTPTPAVTK